MRLSQFITLLKLEFLTKMNRSEKGSKLFPRIIKALIILLGIGIIGAVVLIAFDTVIKMCIQSNIGREFLVFFIFIVQIAQMLFGLSITTNTLYFNYDNDLTKLPIKGSTIFLSKIIY